MKGETKMLFDMCLYSDILLLDGDLYTISDMVYNNNNEVCVMVFKNDVTHKKHEFFIDHICEKNKEGYYEIVK